MLIASGHREAGETRHRSIQNHHLQQAGELLSSLFFASQDAEWVEEEPDAEIQSGASTPRSR